MLEVPDEIKEAQFIKGWNDDAKWHFNDPQDPIDKVIDDQENFLKITVDRAVRLWILFDRTKEEAIIKTRKEFGIDLWLCDEKKFERTSTIARAKGSNIDFTVYRAKSIYLKGTIILGALGSQGEIMYVPLVADASSQAVQPDGKLTVVWGRLKTDQ